LQGCREVFPDTTNGNIPKAYWQGIEKWHSTKKQ
jgi:hypothetical protein